MYMLRQQYQCNWCPLTEVTKKIGVECYQEILKWERVAKDKRLEWTTEAVRALTTQEREEWRARVAQSQAEAEAEEADQNEIKQENESASAGPSRGHDQYGIEVSESEIEVDVEGEAVKSESEDCQIVSEDLQMEPLEPLKRRRK